MRNRKEYREFRKNLTDEHRWMISYADFITLLFGFFVTMYALSSVNEGRYRVLAESIAAALAKNKNNMQENRNLIVDKIPEPVTKKIEKNDIIIKSMTDSVTKAMAPWIERGLINVKKSPVLLQIEINASTLFASGSANAFPEAKQILRQLADVFKDFPNAIHVEGFTDNKPINTSLYPSNWELSAGRAASIVRMFGEIGIDPRRMAAVGYGEYRPIADNSDEAGRNRNRRVVITVLSGNDPRSFVEIVEEANPAAETVTPSKDQESSAAETTTTEIQRGTNSALHGSAIDVNSSQQETRGEPENPSGNTLPQSPSDEEVQAPPFEDYTQDPDLDI